ncbi:MAG: hypothetical protein Q9170_001455 [Blastenia crenularia]
MTQALLRPPTTLQPRPKANPTFSSSSLDTQTAFRTPQQSRSSSETRQPSLKTASSHDNTSSKVTAALVRRVLCSQPTSGVNETKPIEELLPPLTSSNEVDLQLYAIIAIVVKETIYSWYGKITSDQTFVEEVIRIIAHCTRGLESKLRKVDIESLVFDEIPELIEKHILCQLPIPTLFAASKLIRPIVSVSNHPRTVYHELNPHPALSPVPDPSSESSTIQQSRNEADYRQLLVQGALAILLPTEDLENTSLRTLVADVVAETILGRSIGGRVCEGWFIWTSITKLVEAVKAQVNPRATGEEIEVDSRSRLEKFGLLSERGDDTRPAEDGRRSAFSEVVWRLLQYVYLTIITVQFIIVSLFAASSKPKRSSWTAKATADSPIAKSTEAPAAILRPILDFKMLSLLSTALDLSFRMPWLSGSLALMQQHLIASPMAFVRVGAVDGLLDQPPHALYHQPGRPLPSARLISGDDDDLQDRPLPCLPIPSSPTHILKPSLLPTLLSTIRTNLFPRNALPPPAPDPPTIEQQFEIKKICAEALSALLPDILARAAGLSLEDVAKEVESELDVWSDAYLNKHLAYQILEMVVVRVLPEMGEKGVKELMEARGVGI